MTLRIALLGIGNRALPKKPETSNFLGWAEQMARHPGVLLVAAQDPDEGARARMEERGLLGRVSLFADANEMLFRTEADALLVCTPAAFHAEGVELAVEHGLHVIVEKPLVTDPAQGRRLVDMVRDAGLVSTVVQNWRYKNVGRATKKCIATGMLGRVGHIFFRYVRNRENPAYPAYIFEEQDPMLYAMGSHHLDLFRYVLGQEVVEVRGESFRPPWSMYASQTGHALTLRTEGGVFISYVGTISSMNSGLPQESLVIEGESGSLVNDSDWSEPPLLLYAKGEREPEDLTGDVSARTMREQYDVADAFILDDFVEAVAQGRPSDCPLEDSLRSLELVEACRRACAEERTVRVGREGP